MKKRKLFSIFVAAVMIISALPAGAFAAQPKSLVVSRAGDGHNAGMLIKEINKNFSSVKDKFTNGSPYRFYDGLTQTEKIIYNGIVNQQSGVNTKDGDFSVEITNGEDFDLDAFKMRMALYTALAAIVDDTPQFYWLLDFPYDVRAEQRANDENLWLIFDFVDGASHTGSFEKLKKEYNDTLNAAESFTVSGKTRYEQVRSIADGICEMTDYAYEATDEDDQYFYPSYCLLEPHRVVCDGYSKAFKMICDANNIPSLIVVGLGYTYNVPGVLSGGGHAWNYVQMEDGKWYAVDTTWMDDNPNKNEYFLVGSDTADSYLDAFSVTHVTDGNRFYIPNEQGEKVNIIVGYPELSKNAYDPDNAKPLPVPVLNVSASSGGVEIKNGDKAKGRVNITLSSDDDANILKYQYKFNGGEWQDLEGNSLSFNKPMEYNLSFRAVSKSGILSNETALTFTVSDYSAVELTLNELIRFGDVNIDGKISVVDAKAVLQAISGSASLGEYAVKTADVNGDKKLSVVDAKRILQNIAGSYLLTTETESVKVNSYKYYESVPDLGVLLGISPTKTVFYDINETEIPEFDENGYVEFVYNASDINKNGPLGRYVELILNNGFVFDETRQNAVERYDYYVNTAAKIAVTVCVHNDQTVGIVVYNI